MQFEKILVANRGEIAFRIIQCAQQYGYQTVAIYSDADQDAPHCNIADEAICVGRSPIHESYANIAAILKAARRTGAQAIHPGYGFLSEDAAFAEAVEAEKFIFIGPSARTIALMGDKSTAKVAMEKAGVPCIPGYHGAKQDPESLLAAARKIGLPILFKAVAGGGGRGMRLVTEPESLVGEFHAARSEAQTLFNNPALIVEKALLNPRHIEIQILADQRGNCVYLGERDCSLQRRHQKVIEEAPSPFISATTRKAMGKVACRVAEACKYVGAGTVEFLVDAKEQFYFLEMNTRLQVEHPVTELITGIDLVAWQLRIAQGEALDFTQDQIALTGHAMEARVYAEDPEQNFLPQTGQVLTWCRTNQAQVRTDAGIRLGSHITPYYDPMLAKVIAWGENRDIARRRLIQGLENTILLGLKWNQSFLVQLLRTPSFIKGQAATDFIGNFLAQRASFQIDERLWAVAGIIFFAQGFLPKSPQESCPELSLSLAKMLTLKSDTKHRVLYITQLTPGVFTVNSENSSLQFKIEKKAKHHLRVTQKLLARNYYFALDQRTLWLMHAGQHQAFQLLDHETHQQEEEDDSLVLAPMDGTIIDILSEKQAKINKGDTLFVLEAMKMEHPIVSKCQGRVREILVKKGQQVAMHQQLVDIESEQEGNA